MDMANSKFELLISNRNSRYLGSFTSNFQFENSIGYVINPICPLAFYDSNLGFRGPMNSMRLNFNFGRLLDFSG